MKILHTADWHLGHTLHGFSRDAEHQYFLDWLIEQLLEQKVDALLVAGDIFDSANPPISAQAMYYRFLAEARHRCPDLDIVLTAGNHDSPSRLEAPGPLFEALSIHVVGQITRAADGKLITDPLIIPLHRSDGKVAAWCAAIPFLRPADLSHSTDALIEGVEEIYHEVAEAMKDYKEPLIAIGHAYMVDGQLSELSERKILGGNQHALPTSIFSEHFAYTALGHLHRPQQVGKEGNIHYCGSPIPLSLDEGRYQHQVLLLETNEMKVTPLKVPQATQIIRFPKGKPLPLNELLPQLDELETESDSLPPFLEISVKLTEPEPHLRTTVMEHLEGKHIRLCKLTPHYPGTPSSLSESVAEKRLEQLTPENVFTELYQREYDSSPPQHLLSAFEELIDLAHQEAL